MASAIVNELRTKVDAAWTKLARQLQGMEPYEVPMRAYIGALFEFHWKDHAGQLAKIRKAVGLPEAP